MPITYDAKDLGNKLVLDVTIKRGHQWRVRMWLGELLIRLAAWIMWVQCEIHNQDVVEEGMGLLG